jgi:coenzyme PQQ synthesis protein D (PqqD)
MSSSLPMPHTHIVVTEFEGGESVLVDLNTKRYYQLNETATVIWRALSDGRSKAEIVASLTSVYDVTMEDAETSIDQILEHLNAHRLVVTS